MEVLQVSIINEQGKITIPKSIRKEHGVLDKKGRIIWYRDDEGKIIVEIKSEEGR